MIPKSIKSDYSSVARSDAFNGPFTNSSGPSSNSSGMSKFSPTAKIKVIGVGGGGGNVVKRMIENGVEGVEFWAMNTDVQALKAVHADGVIQLGSTITRGLGAGMAPEIGEQSAREADPEIEAALTGADMVFIAAGMGGGTGTGAAPVIAEIAKRLGILTIGVVTKPFHFEGGKRATLAEEGIEKLKQSADAVIIVPNQKLLQIVEKTTGIYESFRISDDVLRQAVQGISDLINLPGEINVDFADVRAVMSNAGTALMGMGRASGTGDSAATTAALQAIESPLIELSIEGARGVLINVQGSSKLTLFDVNEAADAIQKIVDPQAKIIFGLSTDNNLQDEVRVTVIATGFTQESQLEHDMNKTSYGNFNQRNSQYNDPYQSYIPRSQNRQNPPQQNQNTSFTNSSYQSNTNANQNDRFNSSAAFNSQPPFSKEQTEDPDLEIPTFLRNKMRKNPKDY